MNKFIEFWQNIPMHIDPAIFKIGTFEVRYYGLMYIIAFSLTFYLLNKRIQSEKLPYKKEMLESFMYRIIISVLLGARLGYVLFYNLEYFIYNPLEIFLPIKFANGIQFTGISGMSYHGGVIGGAIGAYLFTKKYKVNFLKWLDFVIPAVPIAYTFGRLGNFANGELYGRITTFKFGMHFPLAGADGLLRHASQLYEAFFEGIVLFLILWPLRKKNFVPGFLFGLYLAGYGVFRFCIEFVRQPDAQIGEHGFLISIFSMGQALCFVMIISGLLLMFYPRKKATK